MFFPDDAERPRARLPSGQPAMARAYVNHGKWIADGERPYCNGAEGLAPRQVQVHCTNCHWEGLVEWPADADGIWDVLALRPVPGTRNWFPSGHKLALRSGTVHGQTVADLVAENIEYGTE